MNQTKTYYKEQHTPETYKLMRRANSHTLLISTLSHCFSVGEYAYFVWCKSTHTKQIDTVLNEYCLLELDCLENIPIPKIYQLAGITPPNIR